MRMTSASPLLLPLAPFYGVGDTHQMNDSQTHDNGYSEREANWENTEQETPTQSHHNQQQQLQRKDSSSDGELSPEFLNYVSVGMTGVPKCSSQSHEVSRSFYRWLQLFLGKRGRWCQVKVLN